MFALIVFDINFNQTIHKRPHKLHCYSRVLKPFFFFFTETCGSYSRISSAIQHAQRGDSLPCPVFNQWLQDFQWDLLQWRWHQGLTQHQAGYDKHVKQCFFMNLSREKGPTMVNGNVPFFIHFCARADLPSLHGSHIFFLFFFSIYSENMRY